MRVFVAGATGALGRQLVPRLVAAGHEVTGMTRSESKQAMIRELGAVPVVADALDPNQVAEAVGRARPEVIVHQLTALAGVERYTERDAAPTNGCERRAPPTCSPPGTRPGCDGLWHRG
jgi:nucleoside-diphosphate-sugar epimerase